MKKIIFLLAMIINVVLLYANWRDTGYIEYKQPNGVSFIARTWGDEYFNWMETEDGFRVFQKDNWYCYAILNDVGDFTVETSFV